MGQVRGFELSFAQCKRTDEKWYELLTEGNRKPRRGDIIYCRNASVGSAAIVTTDADFAMGQDVCLIHSTAQNQRFLNYILHSPWMSHQLDGLLVGSTFKRINVSDIKALLVTVPPREEQNLLCDHLDVECTAFDAATRQAEREIALMREYRTRLASDVVTGQLDVREAARSLPDLEPEATALDAPNNDDSPEEDLEGDEAA